MKRQNIFMNVIKKIKLEFKNNKMLGKLFECEAIINWKLL